MSVNPGGIPNLALALQFAGQYPASVQSELEQLLASLQGWANKVSALGRWIDIPPSQIAFFNSGGTWAPILGNVIGVSYRVIGTEMSIRFAVGFGTCTGTVNFVGMVLPLPYSIVIDPTRPVGYIHSILTGAPNVNKCQIATDLDTYVDGIVSVNTKRGPITVNIVPNAFGPIFSGAGSIAFAGQVTCEVTPLT